MQNFHYIQVLLNMVYGIEIEDSDMEELGLVAWGYIGNKNRKLYRYTAKIDPSDNSITLPCNALDINGDSCIELVTSCYEDWSSVSNKIDFGDFSTAYTEQYIEGNKRYQGNYYLPGKVLKYEKVGDKLYFTHNYGKVNILYKGILFDEDGLPEITDKEAMAIATYIAYTVKFKEGLRTNTKESLEMTRALYQQWTKQCDQARVKQLSQNDFDTILDASTSWDRKRFGFGLKAFK